MEEEGPVDDGAVGSAGVEGWGRRDGEDGGDVVGGRGGGP